MKITSNVLVVANGIFPDLGEIAEVFEPNCTIICCDGAVKKLTDAGYEPNIIIGDMDSISEHHKNKYSDIIIHIDNQENNDLDKALSWLNDKNINLATIIAADGGRDDHTLGNILLLLERRYSYNIKMKTNSGTFNVINTDLIDKDENSSYTKSFRSNEGQSISIFCTNREVKLSSSGLKYNLKDFQFKTLQSASLNTALSNSFSISSDQPGTSILIYHEN
tara:strand:- start:30 stop:692 length:663 start_codon:yes stop_codon:yes gene_type:complete